MARAKPCADILPEVTRHPLSPRSDLILLREAHGVELCVDNPMPGTMCVRRAAKLSRFGTEIARFVSGCAGLRIWRMCLAATALLVDAAVAGETPAPPDWRDHRSPSVYNAATLQPMQSALPPGVDRYAEGGQARAEVRAASYTESAPAAPADEAGRRLAPRSNSAAAALNSPSPAARKGMELGLPLNSVFTVGSALAITLGSFMMFVWALKRGKKQSHGGRHVLPPEAVSVLGRVPLAARQFAELLRVGNKLVLVAMTPSGPATITEVTDAAEVDRVVGLCQQRMTHSTTKEFEQVFQQLTATPAPSTFLGDEALPQFSPAATAYRSQRGGARG